YWTNRDVVGLGSLPGSVIVLGGGPVGLELAQALSRFGVDTSVVEAAPRLLPGGEPEVSEAIAEVLDDEGISVRTGAAATRVRHGDDRFTVDLDSGGALSAER